MLDKPKKKRVSFLNKPRDGLATKSGVSGVLDKPEGEGGNLENKPEVGEVALYVGSTPYYPHLTIYLSIRLNFAQKSNWQNFQPTLKIHIFL